MIFMIVTRKEDVDFDDLCKKLEVIKQEKRKCKFPDDKHIDSMFEENERGHIVYLPTPDKFEEYIDGKVAIDYDAWDLNKNEWELIQKEIKKEYQENANGSVDIVVINEHFFDLIPCGIMAGRIYYRPNVYGSRKFICSTKAYKLK